MKSEDEIEVKKTWRKKMSSCCGMPLTWVTYIDDGEPHCSAYKCFKVYPRAKYKTWTTPEMIGTERAAQVED